MKTENFLSFFNFPQNSQKYLCKDEMSRIKEEVHIMKHEWWEKSFWKAARSQHKLLWEG